MSLVVVIVCYRVPDLTIDCLHSLKGEIEQLPDTRVMICENGTGGDSAELIQKAIGANGWGAWVSLCTISPNRGFAGGNNVILREILKQDVLPDYVLLLNADTIVRPGALAELVRAAKANPEAGIICPRLEWPDGEPQISCFRFISPVSEMLDAARTAPLTRMFKRWGVPIDVSDAPMEPQWASFACALIRSKLLSELGILDEGYYLYFDDVDYCRTARNAGWKTLYWPVAHVVHLRGRSNPVKTLTAQRKRRPPYFYASRSRYLAKFYGVCGLLLANTLWSLGRALSILREVLGRKEPHVCEKEWLDIWTNALRPMRK